MNRSGLRRKMKDAIKKKADEYCELQEPLTGEETIAENLLESGSTFFSYIKQNASFFKQSAAAHFLSILAGIFAGVFLASSEEMLLLLPGLIALVPAAIGMRGNIFSSLGSRLSSALHLGTVTGFSPKSNIVKNNFYAVILISILFSVVLALLARLILLTFGITSISFLSLLVISFIGGIISGIVLLFVTFFITFLSYRRGWDPDNTTAPIITALGDMFTVPSLLLASFFVISYTSFVNFIAIVIAVIFFVSIYILIKSRNAMFRKIVLQSAPVLAIGVVFDSFSGLILQSNVQNLVLFPVILFLIPGFLEQGGNIGNILSSRLSTKLHLGLIKPKFALEKEVKIEIINSYIFALILFPLLGIMTYVAATLLGIGGLSVGALLGAVLFSGIILITVIIALAFFVSIISFKLNLDPDNTTLPLIASTADIVGIICLMAVFHGFGIF